MMPTFSDELTASSIDLAARQWKTMGVALAGKAYGGNAVLDPEALILFTAVLGHADARLRDESMDWCIRHGARLISTSRLRNVRTMFPPLSAQEIDVYFSTVNTHAPTRWPVGNNATQPLTYSSSNKSALPRLCKNEALLRFQLRSLFGVTARAEIILALSAAKAREQYHTASELTFTGYSKRNVAMVLEDLALADFVSTKKLGNRIGYRLGSEADLSKLAPALATAELIRWDLRLALLAAVRATVNGVEHKKAVVRSIEARRFATLHGDDFDALELTVPEVVDPESYFELLAQWALDELVA